MKEIRELDRYFTPCIVQVKDLQELIINEIPIGLSLIPNKKYIALQRFKVEGSDSYYYGLYGISGYSIDERFFNECIELTNVN